ncbi:hypothetical protein ES288_D01G172700v1 [Gossypium darwinii]|uniref:Uncharacterized protein n=1 Tax=Gossypium darwinii TaxID=34276 RepID=A0A5D2DQS7_GOSDA|nr:hypothetical protein ES288_D01G172700v1 [Gossypium darwinii]
MKIDGECLMELIGSCRNKFQVSPSIRMPQLNTSLQFHLTPIVMINDLSRCDLLLNSQNFCHSILVGTENPLPSRLCYQRLWGIRNRRAHNLGWTYYLDAFSSYSLRTLLPNIYHGHDNWYTRGASFLVRVVCIFTDMSISLSLSLRQTVLVTTAAHWSFPPGPGHYDPLFEEAPVLLNLWGYFPEYPFVKGLSSFSWEYSMGYFNVVVPGPDSPSVDEPCGGTLGFSGHSIPTNVCVTQADILAFASSTPTNAGKPPRCLYTLPPLSLSDHLGALAGDPGCFPLDDEAYNLLSHWFTSTPVILRSYLVVRVCLNLVPLSRHAPKQCFTLRCPASVGSLNQATAYDSPTHSSTATRSKPWAPPTTWELTISCSISLPDEVLFTLPLRCYFAIGHLGVFSLARWSLLIHTGFHVPHATRVRALLPFHLPLLQESLLLSIPPATKCFSSPQQFKKLTYSGISGSTLIFNSPKHFVAYYALPHLWQTSRVRDKRTQTADIRHKKTRIGRELSPLRLFGLKNAGFYGRSATPGYRRHPWAVSNQNTQQALSLSKKVVIKSHLSVRLPCYDFTLVTRPGSGTPSLRLRY